MNFTRFYGKSYFNMKYAPRNMALKYHIILSILKSFPPNHLISYKWIFRQVALFFLRRLLIYLFFSVFFLVLYWHRDARRPCQLLNTLLTFVIWLIFNTYPLNLSRFHSLTHSLNTLTHSHWTHAFCLPVKGVCVCIMFIVIVIVNLLIQSQ